jgi:hypothetical protein
MTGPVHTPLRPVPEGVASPDGGWIYVPFAEGGVAAVAVASGETRWQRTDALLALLAEDDRVLVLQAAEGARLRPCWLSAADGTPLQPPAPLLPHLAGAPGDWAVTETAWQADRLLLAWQAPRGPGATSARGVLALRPAQLERVAEDVDERMWPAPPPWPGGPDDQPFSDGGAPLPPWSVHGEVVALSPAPSEGGARALRLLRLGAGPAAERSAAVLVSRLPPPGYLLALASPDPGLVTLLHTRHPAEGGPEADIQTHWRFYAAPEGTPLATIAAEDGLVPPFCRTGEVLLARRAGELAHKRARPRRHLCAWHVGDAHLMWQRPLPERSPQRVG